MDKHKAALIPPSTERRIADRLEECNRDEQEPVKWGGKVRRWRHWLIPVDLCEEIIAYMREREEA